MSNKTNIDAECPVKEPNYIYGPEYGMNPSCPYITTNNKYGNNKVCTSQLCTPLVL
jgi:hypothetical protein